MAKLLYIFTLVSFFLFPSAFVFAHQPYLVDSEKQIVVNNPEISKAYYGNFNGTSTVFVINENKPFNFYVGILVPAIMTIPRNITAEIRRDNEPIAFLKATGTDWEEFYEPYGGDKYFQGPEWRGTATSGVYTIILSRPENTGKYVLAIGEKEVFTFDETLRTIKLLPTLKSEYMGAPVWMAYFNRIGIFMAMAFVGCVIAFLILGEIFRAIGRFFRWLFGKPKNVRD
jgi:hypothetical protein